MAKTIDREKNSAARTNAAVRQPQDVEETDPVNAAQPIGDGAEGADDAELLEGDELDEANDASLAIAPVDDERVVMRTGAAGAQVPAFLLANPFTRVLAESYLELRKVTWPSRQDTWNMTIVVIIVSAIMSGLLALADYGLGHLLSYIVSIGLGK